MAYPDDFTSFREIENLPGIVYDPDNRRCFYVEDLLAAYDAIKRLEQVLGLQPQGEYETVAERLAALESSGPPPGPEELTLYVVSDGSLTGGWRAEGGDYQRIDDIDPHDGDTTTLYTPINTDIASFVVDALVLPAGKVVTSVAVHAAWRPVDPVTATISLGVRIGGANYFGTAITNSTPGSYADDSINFEENPATGTAWSEADLGALEIVVRSDDSFGKRLTQMKVVVTIEDE